MTATSRVGMNLLWSVPGVGGSEDYLLRQLMGLAEITHEHEITVYAPRGFTRRHVWLRDCHRVIEAPTSCTNREVRIALEHTWLAAVSRQETIMHHGGGSVPRAENASTVLTMHDVQWVDYPEYVSPRKLAYLRRMVPWSLRRADHVAVPSHFVATTLMRHFSLHEEKVSVVRHGFEPRFVADVSTEADVRARFGLHGRRVISYPAITHPHKNHRFLLSLLAGQGEWADPSVILVCTGGEGRADGEVHEQARQLGLSDRVRFLGRVSAADRNGLIALSEVMVFPSEYEGFGAPVIEAMLLGVPVVCSDRASIPEVVGDAAIVLPLDDAAWADVLSTVATRRERLVEAGRRRAAHFTTAESARELLAVYDKVLTAGGGTRQRKTSS